MGLFRRVAAAATGLWGHHGQENPGTASSQRPRAPAAEVPLSPRARHAPLTAHNTARPEDRVSRGLQAMEQRRFAALDQLRQVHAEWARVQQARTAAAGPGASGGLRGRCGRTYAPTDQSGCKNRGAQQVVRQHGESSVEDPHDAALPAQLGRIHAASDVVIRKHRFLHGAPRAPKSADPQHAGPAKPDRASLQGPGFQLSPHPPGSGQVVPGFIALTAGGAEMPTPPAPTRASSSSMLTM